MGFASIVFPKNLNDKERIAIRKFVSTQIRLHRDLTKGQKKYTKIISLIHRIDGIFYTLKFAKIL